MEFKIAESPTGQFEIIKIAPVVVATLPDRALAKKVMGFLVDEAMADMDATATTQELVPTPVAQKPAQEPIVPNAEKPEQNSGTDIVTPSNVARRKPADLSLPKQLTVKEMARQMSDEAWAPKELEAAFVRLAHGEKLRTVANSFGKSWTKLRATWAAAKKHYAADEAGEQKNLPVKASDAPSPAAIVTAAVQELHDQQSCNRCGNYFTMTADNLDLCARCNHET